MLSVQEMYFEAVQIEHHAENLLGIARQKVDLALNDTHYSSVKVSA
jgi:hypothetical protein